MTKRIKKVDKGTWCDYSIRKEVTPDNFKTEKDINKVIDKRIRDILINRLRSHNGNSKEAFSELDKNPIWFNKENNISIKRVSITGVKNAEPLHYKKDHLGNTILDSNGKPLPVDFVSTSNNHHVAIYRDTEGKLQERVVSFYEAVIRVNLGLPIIFKDPKMIIDKVLENDITEPIILENLPEKDWEFLFTMKQNEMFVFPNEETGFNPAEIDLKDPANKHLISPNLFRVQTLSIVKYGNNTIRDFMFRHHLETTLNSIKELKGITHQQVKSLSPLVSIIKVRINHLGDIIGTGEY